MKKQTWLKGAALVVIAALVLTGCSKRAEAQEGGSGGGSSGGSSRSSVRESPTSDFSYKLTDDGSGIMITRYTGTGGDVVIPSRIEDMPVLEIGRSVFFNKNNITSIIVPDSVEVISQDAFGRMGQLARINLPANLKEIHASAFYLSGGLTDLIIPESITSVKFTGGLSFGGCQKLPIRTRQRIQELGYTGTF